MTTIRRIMVERRLTIPVPGAVRDPVSALLTTPEETVAGYVMAHGAGAGMEHEFMRRMASALASRGVSVLRFNFPYMEAGRRVPGRQATLVQTVRAAVEVATDAIGNVPVFAGGKSMGGRMASIAQAERPLSGVQGLVFLGYPLHAAGRLGIDRARHLSDIQVPFLFVQGSRDRLADTGLMRSVVQERLADRATLLEIDDGDHSLRVPKRSGRTYGQVLEEAAGRICDWMSQISEVSR